MERRNHSNEALHRAGGCGAFGDGGMPAHVHAWLEYG
jgi:hypothetical protein